ncbi:MAG TPA: hypothetical protein VH914_07550 [Acidimicrobiia bacterium]|nr:hypothetical protein [Acidimicrobiia bacterium]
MQDVIFVAILVAFFALAALFVRACDRIIGDETESTDSPRAEELADAA